MSARVLVADDEPQFDRVSDDLAADLDTYGFMNQKLYMTENLDIRDSYQQSVSQAFIIPSVFLKSTR